MKKFISLILVFITVFALSACDLLDTKEEVEIVSIEVVYKGQEDVIKIEEFNLDMYDVIIHFSDDTSKTFLLDEEMIDSSDLTKLENKGIHNIDVYYEGFKTSFSVELIDTIDINNDVTLRLMSIYNLGLESGMIIEQTYEEWLETVRGPQGVNGNQIVLQLADGFIQWQYDGDTVWNNLIDLSQLQGEDGKSTYELYIEQNPNYTGTLDEWLNDLVNNRLSDSSNMPPVIIGSGLITANLGSDIDLLKDVYAFDYQGNQLEVTIDDSNVTYNEISLNLIQYSTTDSNGQTTTIMAVLEIVCRVGEYYSDGVCIFEAAERDYDNDGTLATDQTLEWNIGSDPFTLDPGLNGSSEGGDVINQTFEGLVREIDGIVYPGIAKSWGVSSDGLTITFNLRESKWSDGSDLTADDFVYSWLRAMNPETASEYSWIWEYTNIIGAAEFAYCDNYTQNCDSLVSSVGIQAIDDLTLEVQLINPTDYFVSLMAFYHFKPVKQSAVEAVGGANGLWAKDTNLVVSNGPFVLTDYRTNYGLTLSKNDYYWNASNVVLSKIDGYFIDEESTAFTAFNNGELHFIPSVPTANVPALIATSDEFYVFPILGTYYYSFNMDKDKDGVNEGYDQDGLWSNAKLRTALSYSIDRKAITDTLAAGQMPAVGILPPGFLDHEGLDFLETAGTYGLEINDTNYAEAKLLFAEAAAELNMTVAELKTALEQEELYHNTSEGHALVAQMVQQMWASNLGFTMPIYNSEWAVFQIDRSEGNFSIARGGWLTDYMDPSGLLGVFASTSYYNDPNFYNAEFDALLAAAQTTTDKTMHFEKLYDAYEVFVGQMPIIPVYHYTDTMLVSNHLVDWGRSVLGTVDFSGARIVE